MSRVTLVGPAYPLRGGIAHHVYWLRRALSRHGHAVQVISFRKLYPTLLFPGTSEVDGSRLRLDAGALPILSTLNPLTWAQANQAIKAFRPDAVVFQWWQPFFAPVLGALARLARRRGAAIVFECHNVYPHEGTPLDRRLLRFALTPGARFITHSARDRDDLLALLPGREVGVSPLPSLDEFAGGEAARAGRTILFFGKVRKYKGLNVLLDALPRVLEKVDCRLLIAGEFYDAAEKYRRQIAAHGLAGKVEVEDRYVPNEEVAGLFARADVLVLPYLSASQSGVARIALSNALPVIAADVGGLAEAVRDGETGLLFPAGDAAALADRLITYFTANLGPAFAANLRAANIGEADCCIVELIEQALLVNRA